MVDGPWSMDFLDGLAADGWKTIGKWLFNMVSWNSFMDFQGLVQENNGDEPMD